MFIILLNGLIESQFIFFWKIINYRRTQWTEEESRIDYYYYSYFEFNSNAMGITHFINSLNFDSLKKFDL